MSAWFKVHNVGKTSIFLIKNQELYIFAARQVTRFLLSINKHAICLTKEATRELNCNFFIHAATRVLDTGVEFECYNHVTDWQETFNGVQFGVPVHFAYSTNVTATPQDVQELVEQYGISIVMACHYETSMWALSNTNQLFCTVPVHVLKQVASVFDSIAAQRTDIRFEWNLE